MTEAEVDNDLRRRHDEQLGFIHFSLKQIEIFSTKEAQKGRREEK
jgi:hypothetical protein